LDAVNGKYFGFDTMTLKENNLSVLFDNSNDLAITMLVIIGKLSLAYRVLVAILDVTNETRLFNLTLERQIIVFFIASYGNLGIKCRDYHDAIILQFIYWLWS